MNENLMNENLRKVLEWAVWANLDEHKNAELILLKGHLILEIVMDSFLNTEDSVSNKHASFHKKVMLVSEEIDGSDQGYKVVESLFGLNKIRNQFAHEWQFSVESSGLDMWRDEVLALFPVIRFTRYTFRTKLVHAFAALARALMECEKNSNKSVQAIP
ncbi:MAG: hypothetical protein LAT83_11770 [Kiritimatiellae bacterium]|nr:hypothetical protein [Kiritimatiellia bacterium]